MSDESKDAKVEVNVAKAKAKALRPWFKKKRFWVLAAIVVIGIFTVSNSSKGGSATVKVQVSNVLALNGNTVRVYLHFTNTGTSTGSASCTMNTTVKNQFGDQVNIRVNTTGTNSVAAGASKTLYQDIGVDNGDAPYVKVSDIKLVNC
jgi:hypothetical protein